MYEDLFERGVSVTAIKSMPFHELKYWSDKSQKIRKAETKAYDDAKTGKK